MTTRRGCEDNTRRSHAQRTKLQRRRIGWDTHERRHLARIEKNETLATRPSCVHTAPAYRQCWPNPPAPRPLPLNKRSLSFLLARMRIVPADVQPRHTTALITSIVCSLQSLPKREPKEPACIPVPPKKRLLHGRWSLVSQVL